MPAINGSFWSNNPDPANRRYRTTPTLTLTLTTVLFEQSRGKCVLTSYAPIVFRRAPMGSNQAYIASYVRRRVVACSPRPFCHHHHPLASRRRQHSCLKLSLPLSRDRNRTDKTVSSVDDTRHTSLVAPKKKKTKRKKKRNR